MAKLNIKKGDTVLVLTGKDSNKTAEVLECFPQENKVTVKGINVLVKHHKPRSAQDKGGIVKQTGSRKKYCTRCFIKGNSGNRVPYTQLYTNRSN